MQNIQRDVVWMEVLCKLSGGDCTISSIEVQDHIIQYSWDAASSCLFSFREYQQWCNSEEQSMSTISEVKIKVKSELRWSNTEESAPGVIQWAYPLASKVTCRRYGLRDFIESRSWFPIIQSLLSSFPLTVFEPRCTAYGRPLCQSDKVSPMGL
jgi:hypothetical protein